MSGMKESYSNGLEQCDEVNESLPETSSVLSGTIENLLAKYLVDFAVEGDTVLGYINDLDKFKEILEKMKNLGFAFSVRDSDARQKQREKFKNCEGEGSNELFGHLTIFYQLKVMPIKFFGLPFTIDKTTHYQCAYGCKYYKSKARAAKKSENPDFKQAKTKRVGSKKMGCLAKMTIKHITVYPEYKLDVESDWRKKKKLIENLRKDLRDNCKIVEKFQRFYVSVSVQSSHNHPPIIIKPKLKVHKPKSHKNIDKGSKNKKVVNKESITKSSEIPEASWDYVEIPTSSLNPIQESREELPVKTINLKDDNFFQKLVKFPNTTSTIFEQFEYKPNAIKIEVKPFDGTESTSTIEVYEYQPTIQDLQTIFKEKLNNLYALCNNCTNASLILRLAGDLEQVELQLSNDINCTNL